MAPWHHAGATMEITLGKNGSFKWSAGIPSHAIWLEPVQVRQTDQVWYHHRLQVSSLAVDLQWCYCPLQEGKKNKKGEVLHQFRCYTHTHTTLSHTTLSHTSLSHTIFYTQLFYIQLFHTQHCHTQLFHPTCLAPSPFLPAFPISFSHLLGDHWTKLTFSGPLIALFLSLGRAGVAVRMWKESLNHASSTDLFVEICSDQSLKPWETFLS